ncbi:hypothetical protein EBZ80_10535 [bacterium]|nr:hypothetical protein [bacterium]
MVWLVSMMTSRTSVWEAGISIARARSSVSEFVPACLGSESTPKAGQLTGDGGGVVKKKILACASDRKCECVFGLIIKFGNRRRPESSDPGADFFCVTQLGCRSMSQQIGRIGFRTRSHADR